MTGGQTDRQTESDAYDRTPSIHAQCRTMPINADQNCGIDPNVDQFLSMPINADQFLQMPINARSSRIDPALIGITNVLLMP